MALLIEIECSSVHGSWLMLDVGQKLDLHPLIAHGLLLIALEIWFSNFEQFKGVTLDFEKYVEVNQMKQWDYDYEFSIASK